MESENDTLEIIEQELIDFFMAAFLSGANEDNESNWRRLN